MSAPHFAVPLSSRRPTPAVYALVGLTVAAYALRVFGADSSIAYIPDTQIIREAMDIGQTLASRQLFDINLGGTLKYPLTLPYYLAGIYGVVFAIGFVTRAIPTINAFTTFLFTQRETIHLISVLALSVISALAVPAAYVASRALNKTHTGWLAAGLTAVDLLLVQFSHHARPHAPLATFFLAAVILLMGILQDGGWLRTLSATVLSALAIGTLQSGIVVLVPFAIVWVIRLLDSARAKSLPQTLWSFAVNVILLTCLIGIVNPIAFTDYSQFARGVLSGAQNYTLGGGIHVFNRSMFGFQYIPVYISRLFGYQPVPVAIAPVALPYLIWSLRKQPRILLVFLPLLLITLVMWSVYSDNQPRFMVSSAPFVVLSGAYFLESLAVWVAERLQWPRGVVLGCIAVVVVLPIAATAVRLDIVTAQTDTRTLASQWIERNLPSGATLIGNFQLLELTPTQQSLQQQAADFPGSLGTYNQWLLQQTSTTYPSGPAYDIVEYALYWPEDEAAQVRLIKERSIHYAATQTYTASLSEDRSVLGYAFRYGVPIQVFCPGSNVYETYLPTDIYGWAWQEIWKADRPGPFVIIFELRDQVQPHPVEPICQ